MSITGKREQNPTKQDCINLSNRTFYRWESNLPFIHSKWHSLAITFWLFFIQPWNKVTLEVLTIIRVLSFFKEICMHLLLCMWNGVAHFIEPTNIITWFYRFIMSFSSLFHPQLTAVCATCPASNTWWTKLATSWWIVWSTLLKKQIFPNAAFLCWHQFL